jgi:hypothetical protein
VLERIAGEQRNDLIGSGQAEMRALVGREVRDVGAEQLDLSRIRPQVAADLIEQRGLARAIRADDQAPFARPDASDTLWVTTSPPNAFFRSTTSRA